MGTKDYRLKNIKDELSKQEQELLEEAKKQLNTHIKLSDSEAAYIGDSLILLPKDQKFDYQSNMKIKSPKKVKIDYIAKVQNKELQELLKRNQKKNKHSQGTLRKITSELNKIEKNLCEEERTIENLKRLVENTTKDAINQKQIETFVKGLERNCDKLIDCMNLENPQILDEDTKKEILNKINVLQSYINDLREQLMS